MEAHAAKEETGHRAREYARGAHKRRAVAAARTAQAAAGARLDASELGGVADATGPPFELFGATLPVVCTGTVSTATKEGRGRDARRWG